MREYKRMKKTNYRKYYKFLIIPVVILIVLVAIKKFRKVPHNCNADPPNCSNFKIVELRSVNYTKPTENAIFFLEDHAHNFISPRALCSVEAAAVTNPTRSVFLLTTSPEMYYTPVLRKVLAKHHNIQIGSFNASKLFADSPLATWYEEEKWKESIWPTYDFSDALRWIMLWKYGGTYLDTDIIVMRNLPNTSFVAKQSYNIMTAGAIKLPAKHALLAKCLDDIANNYSPEVWGNAAPLLLTNALELICGNEFLILPSESCPVTVLRSKAFCPISLPEWKEFFRNKKRDDLFEDEEILGLKMWNSVTKTEIVDLRKVTPYTIAAKRFCPTVVKAVWRKM